MRVDRDEFREEENSSDSDAGELEEASPFDYAFMYSGS